MKPESGCHWLAGLLNLTADLRVGAVTAAAINAEACRFGQVVGAHEPDEAEPPLSSNISHAEDLQHDKPVAILHWADAGESEAVSFAARSNMEPSVQA
jgi:hypothetical protein